MVFLFAQSRPMIMSLTFLTFWGCGTVSTWGTLMCETIYAVNGLMGGTVRSNLMHYRCRLVYAAMIRESSKVLRAAARGGGWRPDLTLYALLPPKLFELMLCLPTPLFVMCCWLLGPFMRSSTISPIQVRASFLADVFCSDRPM